MARAIVFDVNETLLDLAALEPVLEVRRFKPAPEPYRLASPRLQVDLP